MAVKEAKLRPNVKPPETKICFKCKQKRRIAEFYSNKDWIQQLGRDIWCKECVSKCTTKDKLREYFWENHREWSERLWESSWKKAEIEASTNTVFQSTTEERRQRILEQLTCQEVVKKMQTVYRYVENTGDIHTLNYQEAKENGQIIEEKKDNVKTYSKEFGGYFKPDEIEYLQDYYRGLEEDFNLSDTNLKDIAKKLAKASLQADKVQDKYMSGQAPLADVKDAMTLFDLLSKSGNFAACKRKPEEKGELGSWAEITYQLETTGHTCTRQIEWPKDDVDRTIDEYSHIITSLGLDSV